MSKLPQGTRKKFPTGNRWKIHFRGGTSARKKSSRPFSPDGRFNFLVVVFFNVFLSALAMKNLPKCNRHKAKRRVNQGGRVRDETRGRRGLIRPGGLKLVARVVRFESRTRSFVQHVNLFPFPCFPSAGRSHFVSAGQDRTPRNK